MPDDKRTKLQPDTKFTIRSVRMSKEHHGCVEFLSRSGKVLMLCDQTRLFDGSGNWFDLDDLNSKIGS